MPYDEIEHRLTFRCAGCQETLIKVSPQHNRGDDLSITVREAVADLERCCGWQFFDKPHKHSFCLSCSVKGKTSKATLLTTSDELAIDIEGKGQIFVGVTILDGMYFADISVDLKSRATGEVIRSRTYILPALP